ncbi:MAG: hypothetical protein ABSD89_07270 [Halobacteriota archaeon]|jgi:hypothetical protein
MKQIVIIATLCALLLATVGTATVTAKQANPSLPTLNPLERLKNRLIPETQQLLKSHLPKKQNTCSGKP